MIVDGIVGIPGQVVRSKVSHFEVTICQKGVAGLAGDDGGIEGFVCVECLSIIGGDECPIYKQSIQVWHQGDTGVGVFYRLIVVF